VIRVEAFRPICVNGPCRLQIFCASAVSLLRKNAFKSRANAMSIKHAQSRDRENLARPTSFANSGLPHGSSGKDKVEFYSGLGRIGGSIQLWWHGAPSVLVPCSFHA
jgi:hypothetical protein